MTYQVIESVVPDTLFAIFEGRVAEVIARAIKREESWTIAFYSGTTVLARLTASGSHTVSQVTEIVEVWFSAEISKYGLKIGYFIDHEDRDPAEVHRRLYIGPINQA